MEENIKLISADAQDTILSNEGEIERLTKAKKLLEDQAAFLIGSTGGHSADAGLAQQIVMAVKDMQTQLDASRRQKTILEEKVGNTLEAMQQSRNHWNTQYAKEKEAQAHVGDLLQKVQELQDKLARREELLRQIDEAGMMVTSLSNGSTRDIKPSSGMLDQLVAENDQLREQVKVVREEKGLVQRQANKLDTENLGLTMEIGDFEERCRNQSTENATLRDVLAKSETELEFLSDAFTNGNHFFRRK